MQIMQTTEDYADYADCAEYAWYAEYAEYADYADHTEYADHAEYMYKICKPNLPDKAYKTKPTTLNAFFSKPFHGPILIFWNLILYTFLCARSKSLP